MRSGLTAVPASIGGLGKLANVVALKRIARPRAVRAHFEVCVPGRDEPRAERGGDVPYRARDETVEFHPVNLVFVRFYPNPDFHDPPINRVAGRILALRPLMLAVAIEVPRSVD